MNIIGLGQSDNKLSKGLESINGSIDMTKMFNKSKLDC